MKTYKCVYRNANIDFGRFQIEFIPYWDYKTGSYFSTSDEDLQEMIESSKKFKDGIITLFDEVKPKEEEQQGEPKKKSRAKKLTAYTNVYNIQDGIEVYKGVCIEQGVEPKKIRKTTELKEAGEEVRISFPNLQ